MKRRIPSGKPSKKEMAEEKKRNEMYDKREQIILEMQIAFTKLANNYSEFIGKVNKIIDKCDPLIQNTLKELLK